MLHVSLGALAALIFVMLVCFILPIAIYYVMYRFSDSRFKTFGKGIAVYFVLRFVIEIPVNVIINHYADMSKNMTAYLLYLLLVCPIIFTGINFVAIKFFGREISSTGNSLMYSLGYTTFQNVVEVGLVSVMYFITLQGIRSVGGNYVVVSEADYVSASNAVSASNLVTDSIYAEMQELCNMPALYFLSMAFERLWTIAVYSAVILVIWLAVKKRGALPLLFAAFAMRILAGVPMMLGELDIVSNKWISAAVTAGTLVVICAAAAVCWRKFIDRENKA